MKRTLCGLILLAMALLAISAVATHQVLAQVPPGVVVDSIAPANDWTNVFPFRAHHVVNDPATRRMAFISGTGANGANPVWLSSADNGQTWSSLTGFLPGGAGRVAMAADDGFNAHITYRTGVSAAAIGIFYNKDPNADGTGLGTEIMVNDTNEILSPNYPDIAVSDDGKHIIITALHWPAMDSLWVFVSHDSGATWDGQVAISAFDPAVAPPNHDPTIMWYTHTVVMGTDGYAILMAAAQYDSMGAGGPYWHFYSETNDYGDTWSTPAWVTPPAASDYPPSVQFFTQGSPVVIDNIPHFAEPLVKAGGQLEMVEFHKDNGAWVYKTVSHYDIATTSYDLANNGSLAVDTLGRLYCIYSDRNKSALPSWFSSQFSNQVFVVGSSDGGNTWTDPVRLTALERQAAGDSGDVKAIGMTQLPEVLTDEAVAIFLNGVFPGLYTGGPIVTAWASVRFPLEVVWTGPYDKDTRAPKPGGYEITASGAAPFNWYEISGMGTKVTGWRNGEPAFGDTARDDGSAGPFPIGFDFWYYGQVFNTFSVGANALLGLSDSILNSAVSGPDPATTKGFFDASYYFPGPGNPFGSVIAAYYNDLDLTPHEIYGTGHGDVYYWTNDAQDTLVVEWYQVGDFNSTTDTTLTFEVILAKADSSVAIMFKDVGNTGTDMTAKVGIQSADTVGVAYWLAGYPDGNIPVPNTGVVFKNTVPTAVSEGPQGPMTFALWQNYPNPFNPATKIAYTLPRQMKATLKVFNVLGQEVATLVNDVQTAGQHTVSFDASHLASGVYLYRLQAGEFTSSSKMILMK